MMNDCYRTAVVGPMNGGKMTEGETMGGGIDLLADVYSIHISGEHPSRITHPVEIDDARRGRR
jgi:hypothetical protein